MDHLFFIVLGGIYPIIFWVYIGLDNMMMSSTPGSNALLLIGFFGSISAYLLIFLIDYGKNYQIKYVIQLLIFIFIIQIYEIYGFYYIEYNDYYPWISYPIAAVCLFYIVKLVIKWRKEVK